MTIFRDSPPTAPSEQALTPETAQAKINEVMGNPEDLYHPDHRFKLGHPERVAEVTKLFEAAHPEPEPAEPARPEAEQQFLTEYHAATAKLGIPEDERIFWEEQAEKTLQRPQTEAELRRGMQAAEGALRQMWGDSFEENLQTVRQVVQQLPAGVQDVLDLGLGNSPPLALRLLECARNLSRGQTGG